ADPAELRLFLADSLHDLELGVGLSLLPQAKENEHALIAIGGVEGVGLNRPIEVSESGFVTTLVELDRRAGGQRHGIPWRQCQGAIEQADRLRDVAQLQGILPGAQVPDRILGLAREGSGLLDARLGAAVGGPELVGQAEPRPVQARIALERGAIACDEDLRHDLTAAVDLGPQEVWARVTGRLADPTVEDRAGRGQPEGP